jgi:hypothetical protein
VVAGVKCWPIAVSANLSPIKREKSSTELRGRWFTETCWASPAVFRVTLTTTPVRSPLIGVVYCSRNPLSA